MRLNFITSSQRGCVQQRRNNKQQHTRSLKEDTISGIIKRYKDHASINLIKSKNNCLASTFFFTPVSKAAQGKVIHTINFKRKFRSFCSSCAERYQCFHFCFKFPNDLKETDTIPVYKKKSKLVKKNYRPINIHLNISKVYERCLHDQMWCVARFGSICII